MGDDFIFWKQFDRRFTKRFLTVTVCTVGLYFFFALAVTVVSLAVDNDSRPSVPAPPPANNVNNEDSPGHPAADIDTGTTGSSEESPDNPYLDEGGILRPPARTNFMLIGLDNNLLADAIMVGTFYRDSGNIRFMSIPRDMYTRIPEHRLEQMRADGLRPPSTLKINAMRAFGGRAHGVYYLMAQLGEMLGVHFHYYVEVELDAFRRIVDAIDGVEMYVPRRFFYEDPYQDLIIDIPAGLQVLDGAMAEGFVRFRSFPTGDLARNEMQMEFMTQLVRQALTREAIMNDPLALANIIINDVRTNIGFDLIRYLPYIGNVRADGIYTFTLPGNATYINGVSWFVPDAQRLPGIVNQVFYATPSIIDTQDTSGDADDSNA